MIYDFLSTHNLTLTLPTCTHSFTFILTRAFIPTFSFPHIHFEHTLPHTHFEYALFQHNH